MAQDPFQQSNVEDLLSAIADTQAMILNELQQLAESLRTLLEED